MNTIEFLKSKCINTVFCINPFVVSDKRENELKPEHQVRGVTDKELIIELDIEEGFDTSELRQKLYELQLKNFDRLSAQGFEVYLFNHKGKCPHIRLYNFEGMNKQNQESYYINFVQKYCEPKLEHTKYDKSFYASFHWCPIEFHSHYKYGTIYELEKFSNVGSKNIVDASLVTEVKEEGKRKVELDYLQILSKVDATEQDRVSCVMQIVNKMKLNKDETMGFISKHCKWSNFNPIITAEKLDYIWAYTDKPNPLQKEVKPVDYDEEFIVSEGKVDFNSMRESLKEQHNHLRLFPTIDSMLGLDGDKYYATKKWLCYFYESSLQKPMQIKVGASHYDNRTHALIIATAGKGKGVIKNTVKNTMRFEMSDVVEASGLVHPEQMIGKMKEIGRGKDKHKVEAKGYLAARILIHDETNSVINETAPNADQTMRIKRTAMDTYGFNLISKKLVDDFIKDALEYYPDANCLDFMHPEQFSNCFFDKGTYRRYVCFELANNKQLDVNDSIKSLFEEATNYDEQRNMLSALRDQSRGIYNDFKFNDDCKKIAGRWIIMWNSMLLNHHNSAVRRFGEMTFFSIKEYFFKMIAILHLANGKEISEPELTHAACIDTFHFLIETLENYCKFGDIANTSDVWRGAKGMEIKALEYLYRKQAHNQEVSKVTIKKFTEVISELFGVQERQAKGIMSNLKAKGWIGSKQVGQDDSRVWITFKPELSGVLPIETTLEQLWGQEFEGCKGCKVFQLDGIIWFIKHTSTRINPIINKKNNNYNGLNELKQGVLTYVHKVNQVEVEVVTPNMHVVSGGCIPCNPAENSGSKLAQWGGGDTSTTQSEADVGKVCQVCGMREAIEEYEFNEVSRWLCVDCLVRAKEIAVRRSALKSNSE
jgi:hypothetical protein